MRVARNQVQSWLVCTVEKPQRHKKMSSDGGIMWWFSARVNPECARFRAYGQITGKAVDSMVLRRVTE